MDDAQQRQRRLIQRLLDYAQTDATNLARRAGVAHTTVTRFMQKDSTQQLSMRTLDKLVQASGLPQSEAAALLAGTKAGGESRPEISHYLVEQPNQIMILMIWEALSTAEKTAVLQYIKTLRSPKKSGTG